MDYVQDHFSFRIIDLDLVGHEVLKLNAVKERLVSLFGRQVLQDSGEIDRVILGHLVFSSQDALSQLNRMVHPEIKALVLKRLETIHSLENCIIVGALIKEIGLNDYCEQLLFIDVDRDALLRRMPEKDCIIRHQSGANLYRLDATYVIRNDFSDRFFKDGMQVFKELLR